MIGHLIGSSVWNTFICLSSIYFFVYVSYLYLCIVYLFLFMYIVVHAYIYGYTYGYRIGIPRSPFLKDAVLSVPRTKARLEDISVLKWHFLACEKSQPTDCFPSNK